MGTVTDIAAYGFTGTAGEWEGFVLRSRTVGDCRSALRP